MAPVGPAIKAALRLLGDEVDVAASRQLSHFSFDIAEGEAKIGQVRGFVSPNGKVNLQGIEVAGGPGTLGPAATRRLIAELQSKIKGTQITSITGQRISGARQAAGVSGDAEFATVDLKKLGIAGAGFFVADSLMGAGDAEATELVPGLFPNVEERLARQQRLLDPATKRQVAGQRREMLVESLDQATDDVKRYGPAGTTAVHAFDFFATGDVARSVLGGVRDAGQEVIDSLGEFRHLTGDVQDKLLEAVGVPERFAKLLSPDLELPDTETETVVGQAVRPVVSFLAGFLPLNRALKAAGVAGNLTRDVLASAGAGALTVPHDLFTLADGLAEIAPGPLADAIPDFLRSDPGDSTAEAKLKQAANEALGAGIGSALVRPLVSAFRYVRGASHVRQAAGVPGSAQVPQKPPKKDRLGAWWSNNLVSGLSTQVLNAGTNLANTMLVPAERIVATTLAHGPRQGLTEARATTWGFLQGLEDAFRLSFGRPLDEQGTVVQAFVKGQGITDPMATKLDPGAQIMNPPDLRTVFQGGPTAILGNILDTMITSGGTIVGGSRGLITGDEAFKTLLHRMELHRLAAKEGFELGFTGTDFAKYVQDRVVNPDDAMLEQALEVARYGTFTQALGPKGQALMDFKNTTPIMKFFFPFVRTPVNIFKFAVERTPLAPTMKHVRDELGSADPMVRALAMTRVTYGSAMMAVAAKWAAEGLLTGGGPVDPELRKLMMGDKPPYSVLIGDKWVQYNRAQPWGFILGFATDLYAVSGQISDNDFEKALSSGIAATYRNTLDFPFTQGFSELSNLIHNGWREGDTNVVLRQAGDILTTFATPRLVAQYARADEPVTRSARTILDQLRNQVPGYRTDLPVMHDALGDEVLLNEGFGEGNLGVFTRFAVPAVVRRDADRFRDVREFLQEHEVDVGMPTREIRGVKIDEATYQRIVKRQGQVAVPMVRQLMANPAIAGLTRPQLERRVKAVFAGAREMAKGEVLAASPELQRRAAALGAGLMEPERLSMQRGMLSTELPQ